MPRANRYFLPGLYGKGEGTFAQNVPGNFLNVGTPGQSELAHNRQKRGQQVVGLQIWLLGIGEKRSMTGGKRIGGKNLRLVQGI
jgi:hypothetical protein